MIVCDIDGTLCDFDTLFDSYIRQFLNDLEQPIRTEYDFRQRYPSQNPQRLSELFDQFVAEGMFYHTRPYPGIEKINMFYPTIITSRPKETANDTYAWLIDNGIKFKQIIMTRDKSKFINETELIFEDKGKNILPFAEAGIPSYLFNHDYNINIKHPNITRLESWEALNTDMLSKYAYNRGI